MTKTTEELILEKLTAIEQRINQIFVPLVAEKQRQIDALPADERKRVHQQHMRELRAQKGVTDAKKN